MYKLFTQDQATELIRVVEPLLLELQEAFKEVVRLRDERAILRPDSLRAQQLGAELNFVVRSAQVTKQELDHLGVLVKDVEHGVVDFPSTVAGEVVYLCWEQGEHAITHYHALNQEVSARQPLPQRDAEARASA
jgi:hypothetical protein